MIVQEYFKLSDDGWELVKTRSDAGMMIRQDSTGDLYEEATDPVFTGQTYTETDIPIEPEPEPPMDVR